MQYSWESRPTKTHARNLSADLLRSRVGSTASIWHGRDTRRIMGTTGCATGGETADAAPCARDGTGDVRFVRGGSWHCKAMGKRLPSTIEWQHAAQGTTQQLPWGNTLDPACLPPLETGRTTPGAKRVDAAYPSNCSSVFGVRGLAGNVWQFTSSFTDAHTRRVVLQGGSNYRPMYKPGVPAFNLNKPVR